LSNDPLSRRWPQVLREHVSLAFGLGFLAFLCLGWSLQAAILHLLAPDAWARALGRFVIMAGFRFYLRVLGLFDICRFDLRALDALRGQGPLIVAPNHPSLLDAVMVLSRLPNVACILKAGLLHSVLFGAGARLARYIPNDAPLAMIKRAVGELRRGGQLLIFPEGTRTTRAPVNAFQGGIGLIAARAQTPIQTVFIEADSAFLGKRWPLLRPPNFPVTYRLRLGKRFEPPKDAHLFMRELEEYFAAELSGRVSAAPSTDRNSMSQTSHER
jgi:1-acyl-sn-glycerol-3-phosphate acyltransferase